MTVVSRIRRRRLRRRREREAKELAGIPLREFVYLDEVSVYSLIASRKGPIATDYRDTASTLLRSEIGGTLGGNVGVAKSEVSSKIESSQTSEMQVVRKAVIQSTFRELYESERENLALKVTDLANAPKQPVNLDGLRTAIAARDENDGWLIDPRRLTRGQMIEVDVELRADKVFGFSTAVAAIVDMVQGDSALTSGIDKREVREIVEINGILQRMLVGLVPLQGRVVHYRGIVVDGDEWLVHEHLLARIAADELTAHPVFLVGVAEQQLFWKDIRRILFSRSRYRVLARLGRDGTQADWSPVKSLDVLEDAVPGLARPIADAIRNLPAMMAAAEEAETVTPVAADAMLQVLIRYGAAIANRYGRDDASAAHDLIASGTINVAELVGLQGFEDRREAFASVADHVVAQFEIDLDAEWAANLRKELQTEAGLWPPIGSGLSMLDKPASEPADDETEAPGDRESPRYLDAEIVAVYW